MSAEPRRLTRYGRALEDDEQRTELGDARRTRQGLPERNFRAQRPDRRPADELGFFGRKQSRRLRQHEEELDEVDFLKERMKYVFAAGTEVDAFSFCQGVKLIEAGEREVIRLAEGLAREFAVQSAFDMAERTRNLATDVSEEFRQQALRR